MNPDTIRKLTNAMPILNKKVAAQQKAAQAIKLQQLAQKQPAAANVTAGAQAIGTQLAGEQAKQQLSNEQQRQQQLSALGTQAISKEQQVQQKALTEQQLITSQKSMVGQKQLAETQQDLENRMFNARTTFSKNQLNETEFNEYQMLDLASALSKDDQDALNRAQVVEQAMNKDIMLSEHLKNGLIADLQGKFKRGQQKLTIENKKEIEQYITAIERDIARKQARASDTRAIISGIAKVAGVAAMA